MPPLWTDAPTEEDARDDTEAERKLKEQAEERAKVAESIKDGDCAPLRATRHFCTLTLAATLLEPLVPSRSLPRHVRVTVQNPAPTAARPSGSFRCVARAHHRGAWLGQP